MPFIRITCPEKALTAEQKAQLAPLLTDGVMGQEVDPVTDAARVLTALLFNEIADHIRIRSFNFKIYTLNIVMLDNQTLDDF